MNEKPEWKSAPYGPAEHIQIGRFRATVNEVSWGRYQNRPENPYTVAVSLDVRPKTQYASREEAEAAAIKTIRRILMQAQEALDELEGDR